MESVEHIFKDSQDTVGFDDFFTTGLSFIRRCLPQLCSHDTLNESLEASLKMWLKVFERAQELNQSATTAKSDADWRKIEHTMRTKFARMKVAELKGEAKDLLKDCAGGDDDKQSLVDKIIAHRIGAMKVEEKTLVDNWGKIVTKFFDGE
eukprot:7069962-Alexandrium_andersonii.AAC.1